MNEDKIEQSMLEILAGLGYEVLHGPDGNGERDYTDAALNKRLAATIERLNITFKAS